MHTDAHRRSRGARETARRQRAKKQKTFKNRTARCQAVTKVTKVLATSSNLSKLPNLQTWPLRKINYKFFKLPCTEKEYHAVIPLINTTH